MPGLPDPCLLDPHTFGERKIPDLVTTDPRIWRALELFHQARTVHLRAIASSLNLSESRFRHLFKQELGVSPTHYVKIARLGQAQELLKSSFLTIKEVAVRVGVNDVSHFVRDYKALFGQTPSEARQAFARESRGRSRVSRLGQ